MMFYDLGLTLLFFVVNHWLLIGRIYVGGGVMVAPNGLFTR